MAFQQDVFRSGIVPINSNESLKALDDGISRRHAAGGVIYGVDYIH